MGLGRSSGAPPSSEKKRSLGSAHWHVTWQSARWRAIARSPFVPRRRSGGAPAAAPDLLRHVGAGCLPLHAAPSAPCGQAGAARHGGTPTPGRTPLETRSPCRVAAPCASPVRACPPAKRQTSRRGRVTARMSAKAGCGAPCGPVRPIQQVGSSHRAATPTERPLRACVARCRAGSCPSGSPRPGDHRASLGMQAHFSELMVLGRGVISKPARRRRRRKALPSHTGHGAGQRDAGPPLPSGSDSTQLLLPRSSAF